jgi:hypothetical protein
MQQGLLLLLPLMLGAVAPVGAQARSGPVEVRAGAAFGWARTAVAGEASTDVGPLLTGQVGYALSTRTDLTLDLAVQPFKAQNPVADEAFRAGYGLAGIQVGVGRSRRVYLRPEVGLVYRSWSGSQVFKASETSPAAGLGVGGEMPVGRALGLAAEAFVRLSGAEELSTALVGVGLSLVPIGARPRGP